MPALLFEGTFFDEPVIRFQQAVVLLLALAGPLFALLPVGRHLREHPLRTLLAILILDFGYMLWATVPYVAVGVDESSFLINGYVLGGSDLFAGFMRPPLPTVGMMLVPFHPPLLGMAFKLGATVLTYVLVARSIGPRWGLLAAWLATVSSLLCQWSCYALSEPYGAVLTTLFVIIAARARWASGSVLAGLAFLCRFPLALLLPFAVTAGWLKRGWWGGLLAVGLFFAPAVLILPWTQSEPWRVLMDRWDAYGEKSILLSVWYYLQPGRGLGLGLFGMIAAVWGAWWSLRAGSPELRWSAVVFFSYTGLMFAMGEQHLRYFTPVVPLGVVVVVHGCKCAVERFPGLTKPVIAGLCAGVMAIQIAVPVQPPKIRKMRRESRGLQIQRDREQILDIVGDHYLYTDFDFFVLTAILGHPCPAVPQNPNLNHKNHPPGVELDFGLYEPTRQDGVRRSAFPPVERAGLPRGSFYLTYDPAGRQPLWSAGDLYLVRW